eukprot:1469921-Prymnesium_polylepis.1
MAPSDPFDGGPRLLGVGERSSLHARHALEAGHRALRRRHARVDATQREDDVRRVARPARQAVALGAVGAPVLALAGI